MPLTRVLALNLKEWWIILLGILGAVVTGGIFPVFAIPLGAILWTFTVPPDQEHSPQASPCCHYQPGSLKGIDVVPECHSVSQE